MEMGKNWKKGENEKGFIYYLNELTNQIQWDHPKFCEIKQAIDDCNYIIFPLYRIAFKFRAMQRSLYMEEVPLSIINDTFERHRLGSNENSLILDTCDLEAILSDIFFATNKKNHTNIDVDFATEIVINFVYNVFDNFREGNIQVFATKVILGLLSNCSSDEIYKFLFALGADHNSCITRLRLQGLLLKIFDVIKYLHEDVSLGYQHINLAIKSCFFNSPGLIGVTENNFIGWLGTEPPFLSWISLISKLKSSEIVIHSVKCTTCKTRPLMGLLYRCKKCSPFTQCQRCFLTGRLSHSHKLSHSVREYYGFSRVEQNSSNFFMKMCSLFCPVAVETNFRVLKASSFNTELNKNPSSTDHICDVEPLSSPQSQLQNVIRQLESLNRELQQLLILGSYSDREIRKYLEEYRIFMAGNITKLKLLKNQINADSDCVPYIKLEPRNPQTVQSTPMVQVNNTHRFNNKFLENNLNFKKDYENRNIGSSTENNLSNGSFFSDPDINLQSNNDLYVKSSPVKILHNDLDEALARLQQILANNFSMEDSLNPMDNTNLKYAVTEVEDMLTSIIDNVESSRSSSVLPSRT